MKKFTAMLLAMIICFSLCACGEQASENTPVPESFSFRDGIHFNDSINDVADKEKRLDVDYDNPDDNGYISAQADDGIRETLTFEGIEDAYLFYFFDNKTKGLSEIMVMFGRGDNMVSAINTYEIFVKDYYKKYGAPLTEDQKKYVPVDTVAYEYSSTHYKDTELLEHSRWLLPDSEGYVIIDVTTSINSGDSYYNFIGFRHVTKDEFIALGGSPEDI